MLFAAAAAFVAEHAARLQTQLYVRINPLDSGLAMHDLAAVVVPGLAGITWGAEDLSAAIGAIANRDADGQLSPLYTLANSLCLCAAAAAGVPAIDTVYTDFRDAAGLAASCAVSRRRGYRGRIAIHPDQVEVINAAFSPSEAELAHARRVVDAFAAQPDAGTVGLDGAMLDLPHLKQARRTLGIDG